MPMESCTSPEKASWFRLAPEGNARRPVVEPRAHVREACESAGRDVLTILTRCVDRSFERSCRLYAREACTWMLVDVGREGHHPVSVRYRYPTPRTVSTRWALEPSLWRSVLTTASTTLLPPA